MLNAYLKLARQHEIAASHHASPGNKHIQANRGSQSASACGQKKAAARFRYVLGVKRWAEHQTDRLSAATFGGNTEPALAPRSVEVG